MGLMAELRNSLENPATPLSYPAEWLIDAFNGGRSDSGIRVSEMVALQVSTVYACVNLISGAVGALDLQIYERLLDHEKRIGKRVAYDHDLFELLAHAPNSEMTSITLRRTLQCHTLLWGNFYAELQRDEGNRIVGIWPRNPTRCKPCRLTQPTTVQGEKLDRGDMVYKTTEGQHEVNLDPQQALPQSEAERAILKENMLHVPGLSIDGRLGQSVIYLARNAVGLSLATERFGGKFFGNGALGYGMFEIPHTMKPEDREKFRQSAREAFGGENQQSPMVLEGGTKFTPTSTKPNEGQFIETRKYQKSDICSLFGVPPHMVGDTDKTNRANTEQIGLEFVTFTLRPWLKAWQQELKRKVFPQPATGRSAARYFFAMFDTRPLTMPAADSRRQFYASGKQWGYLSTNMILEMEDINPVEDPSADAFWMPINMQDMATAFTEPAQGPGPADPDAEDDAEPDKLGQRFVRAYFRMFRDAFGRMVVRSKVDSGVFRRAFLPVLLSIGEELQRLAAEDLEIESQGLLIEEGRFLDDYLESMRSRVGEWQAANGHGEQVAERELKRAVKAISVEIYRSLATLRAKTLVEA